MSQCVTYKLLKILGGEATSTEIIKLSRSLYPNSTLYSVIGNRLTELKKSGYIKFVPNPQYLRKHGKWIIIEEYPEAFTYQYNEAASDIQT